MISVLMSTFNNEFDVGYAIRSILNQDYQDFEFLIVDDCSTDNTYEVLNKFKNNSNKIKLFRNKSNIGLTKSLNFLLKQSNGTFIARQDADDYSFPNRLSKQVDFINQHNLHGCTSRSIVKNKVILKPNLSYYLPKKIVMKLKNPFIHGSLLLKKSVFNKIGYYDENFYYAQDYKLFSDLLKSNYKIKMIHEPLYVLNFENNISSNFKTEQKYFAKCVKKNIQPSLYEN